MAARTVLLNLIGQDRISRVLQRIRRETGETGRQVDQLNRTSRRAGRDIDRSFAVIMKRAAKFASIGLGAGLAITQAAQLAAFLLNRSSDLVCWRGFRPGSRWPGRRWAL